MKRDAKNWQPLRSLFETISSELKNIPKIGKQEVGWSVGDIVGFLEDLMMEESPLLLLQ